MKIRKLATEHFEVSLRAPFDGGQISGICLSENNVQGGNNTIYFKRNEIRELIKVLQLADQEFGE